MRFSLVYPTFQKLLLRGKSVRSSEEELSFLYGKTEEQHSKTVYTKSETAVRGASVSEKFKIEKNRVKLWFDISMLILSVVLALVLNHNLNGVGIGTIIITVVNAPLIKIFGGLLDRLFTFDLRFPSLGKFLK